ncbi:MAG: ribose-phosphate diphosphokinase [Ureaplasma sp.]|nr:ribose-phosphate diphosphokinase [Ureaplasma sp.]
MINKEENNIKIFGLSGSKNLIKKIQEKSDFNIGEIETIKFADGEIMVKLNESVRGNDVVLIQSTNNPVNEKFMELLIAIDACKRASAKTINVIIPYFAYSRQDRKSKPREPITFKLIANMLETAGATRILTFDIHSPQTQGFFDIPFDSLEANWLLLNEFINKTKIKEFSIVAPDYGSIKRSRDISQELGMPLVIVDKRRPRPNEVEISNILGDCKNQDCVIVDDMIDTGGTMLACSKLLKDKGAKSVSVLVTHALFNNDALAKFEDAVKKGIINNIIVSDTIERQKLSFINVTSIDDFLIQIIKIFSGSANSMSEVIMSYKSNIKNKLHQIIKKN